jgi:hypothetical protein
MTDSRSAPCEGAPSALIAMLTARCAARPRSNAARAYGCHLDFGAAYDPLIDQPDTGLPPRLP